MHWGLDGFIGASPIQACRVSGVHPASIRRHARRQLDTNGQRTQPLSQVYAHVYVLASQGQEHLVLLAAPRLAARRCKPPRLPLAVA